MLVAEGVTRVVCPPHVSRFSCSLWPPGLHGARQASSEPGDAGPLETVLAHLQAALAQIEDGQTKDSLQQSLPTLQAHLSGPDAARSSVESMGEGPSRDFALAELARNQADAGDSLEARRTIDEIQSPYHRGWALGWVAQKEAEAGRANEALALLGEIENPQARSDSMKMVGLFLARRGQGTVAEQTLAQAAEAARQMEIPSEQAYQLMSVARTQHWAKQTIGMQRTLVWAQAAIDQVEDPDTKGRLLARLATLQTSMGREGEAHVTEGAIDHPQHRWEPRAARAAKQAKQGDAEGAVAILDAAEDVPSVEEAQARGWALENVVNAHIGAGDFVAAREVVNRMPPNHPSRAHSLSRMARALWWRGRDTEAEQAFDDALEAAEQVEDPWMRDQALRIAAENLGQTGQAEQALGVVEGIERKNERENAFHSIAMSQGRRGEMDAALDWILQVRDPAEQARALLGLAGGLVTLDQHGPPRPRQEPSPN